MKILLAMSGGIDSSVVAHMLHAEGHEVIGVRFTLWTDPLAPALAQILPSKCCTTQNIARADRVAKSLKIPLHIINLEDEFKRTVVDPYLDAHLRGLTPNPCIGCNRTIKFGKLLEMMEQLGCEKLATGHYARVMYKGSTYRLLRAVDTRKDQSYYLYGLSQEQLSHVIFPLGNMKKSDVYALAQHYALPLSSSYRESQDLCFFPEKKPAAFLRRHLGSVLKSGDIVLRDGGVVGRHKGIALYTIGQRHGLGIGGLKIPLEVITKDHLHNRLIVDEKGKTKTSVVMLRDMHYTAEIPRVHQTHPFSCRMRSLSTLKEGMLIPDLTMATFQFVDPQPLPSPGQSLVLYRGEEVVGGGVIDSM